MKKIASILLGGLIISLTIGCSELRHRDLYKITDKVVESLYTTYQSYGMFGGTEEYTSDKEYKVMPIGRLVNVRIEHEASNEEYEDLIEDLKSHYKNDSHVRNVYRCQAGTIMIDCRN